MGLPVEVNNLMLGSLGGYTVGRSLRFRSSASAYLSRTPASAGNRQIWTYSFWLKKGGSSGSNGYQYLTSATTVGSTNPMFVFRDVNDQLEISNNDSGGTNNLRLTTTAVYRDFSAWYHIVLSVDTTQATSSNRAKLYVNGIQVTAFGTATYPSQNTNLDLNGAIVHNIGREAARSNYYTDGYLAEVNFIDGQALTPSSFGAYDTNGVWQPKKYSGTYGTNGFYLPFSNTTSTTTLVQDSSGNGNNWTPNNISLTSGTTYDSMIDSPTNSASSSNYAVMNPLDSLSGTASNGNLLWTAGAAQSDIRGTIAIPSSGKFYMECTVGSTTNASSAASFGLATSTVALNSSNAVSGLYQLYASSSGYLSLNGTNVSSSLGVWTAGDILQIAVDVDNTKMWLGKNNTWYDSSGGSTGNPSTGANATSTTSMVGLFPFSNCYSNNVTWNMGQRPFSYTPPTGFNALNTYNLPAPSIANGAQYMAATTYTGNGTAGRVITVPNINEVGFAWVKSRSGIDDHRLANIVTGGNKHLKSNTTDAESTGTNIIQAFSSNTFTVGNDTSVNANGSTYVGWTWAANGTGVTNNSGTITSTVSASPSSGFSIATYTGNGSSSATVGHGLNSVPSMIICKGRSYIENWWTFHQGLGSGNTIQLDTTAASVIISSGTGAGSIATNPTSSVFGFTAGSGATVNNVNQNGETYVAYCFSAVSGYSAFGKYSANGSTDGPFIYTGFRPRFILSKRTDSSTGGNWQIEDTSRATYNVVGPFLRADTSDAEGSGTLLDILSNGFKIRTTDTGWNASGGTYIYAAFAENPFNYSRAR